MHTAGELLALRWADVDFAGAFVRGRADACAPEALTSPKNHQRRRVDLSLRLIAELLEYGASMPPNPTSGSMTEMSGLLFRART